MDDKMIKIVGRHGVPDYQVTRLNKKIHRTALVIPILNEKPRIVAQLEKIKNLAPNVDIIIIDGGSTDGTQEILQAPDFGISTFLLKTGAGQLSAQLRAAFHFCIQEGYDSIITMDGNDKDDVSGINSIKFALDSGIDFVQGSRFLSGGKSENTPLVRYLAIRLVHAPITSIAARYWYTDTTNGFRGHSASLLRAEKVSIFRDVFVGYELLAYLPICAARQGFKVTEVPVIRRYPVDGKVPTKIRGLRGQMQILKILFKASFNKFSL